MELQGLPAVALRWFLSHAVSADAELASIAKLSLTSRNIVRDFVLNSPDSPLLLPSMVRKLREEGSCADEHFCAAWFHPDGIQETLVSASGTVLCSHEWRGYRQPYEVLQHFGYDQQFVEEVLNLAVPDPRPVEPYSQPNFCVRGAVVARPESYCLCLDHSNDSMHRHRELQRAVFPIVLAQPRSIQFLNASQQHAVCMMTPRFACGPLLEPVTVFCVAIATEDGCFLSGLYHRFELGHLHPPNKLTELTERSPVCLAAEVWTEDVEMASQDSSDDDRSDDFECKCIFQGVVEKLNAMEDSFDDPRVSIRRGRSGPGRWHCYTAVYDGPRSFIRVDGKDEPMSNGDVVDGSAKLDGLTLGSDHDFGVSLCGGVGSDGEGEGAIAEVAVFNGRLDLKDIEAVEKTLMEKHRISPLTELWTATDLERKAHALLQYPPIQNLRFEEGVPLKYLAKHRSVAWERYNAVSGTRDVVKRIGARPGASSSEW